MPPPKMDANLLILRKAIKLLESQVEQIEDRVSLKQYFDFTTIAKDSKIGKPLHFYRCQMNFLFYSSFVVLALLRIVCRKLIFFNFPNQSSFCTLR